MTRELEISTKFVLFSLYTLYTKTEFGLAHNKSIESSVLTNHLKEPTQLSDSFANRTSLSCVAYQRGLSSITSMCNTFLCPVLVKTLINQMFSDLIF